LKKILFVHEVFGRFSEVFVYRMLTQMKSWDVTLLTGKYINRDAFPFPEEKIYFWDPQEIRISHKLRPWINRKLHLQGSYSALHSLILEKIRSTSVDLVCFQFGTLPIQFGKDIKRIGKKFCIFHHGSDVNRAREDQHYRQRLLHVWEEAEKIFFVSEFLREVAVTLGAPKEKTEVRYLGVPCVANSIYMSKPNSSRVRFICVARFVPVKNHINLIRAFAKLFQKGITDAELVLIGSGEEENHIRDEVQRLSLDDKVVFKGAMENSKVLDELSRSDVVVLVSRIYKEPGKMLQEEALGISLLEGAARALPMIGSTTGGIPEIVIPGVTGYAVDPEDPDEIAQAMLLMIEDPEGRERMGKEARFMVEKKFSLPVKMQEIEESFHTLLGGVSCH